MMIARWNKALAAVATCALFAGGLTACGTGASANGDAENITLVVWASQEDQANEDSWLQEMEKAFQEEHPEYNITWKNQVVASADAAGVAKQDPTVAADVYSFASDQLGTLLDAGAIGQVSDPTMAQLEEQTEGSETMLDTVRGEDGNVYGVPLAGNTWFMYYRKSKFTEEDITSLDAMLAKGKVSFPLTNSWYVPAFYMGAGGELFGPDGTDGAAGVQFGGEIGAAVTEYLVNFRNNPNFVLDQNGSGLAGLKDGSVDVVFTGNWDAATVRANLGDDWGVAQLPCFTLNGQQVQMKAFAGSTVYAWNPYARVATTRRRPMPITGRVGARTAAMLRALRTQGVPSGPDREAGRPEGRRFESAIVSRSHVPSRKACRPSCPRSAEDQWRKRIAFLFDLRTGYVGH